MAQIPPGRYTRQQLRDRALTAAGNRALDAEAAVWLRTRLFTLATLYDWPFLNTAASVTLGATFPLPSDYYQAQDDRALRLVTVDGRPYPAVVRESDRAEVDDLLAAETKPGQIPRLWHADLRTGEGRVAPNPTGRLITATLRYRMLPAEPDDAAEPTDVPWFPWHEYLIQALFVDALRHEDDSRVAQEQIRLEEMFAAIRRGSVPLRSQSPTIPHDPRVFTTPFRG